MAASRGVVVVRRFTGGGAVYHDPGNLNVTVVGSLDQPPFDHAPGRRLPGIYGIVLDPLERVVADLGLHVERTERDLLLNGRKISGVAAWFGARAALVHATLLVDADLETLDLVLSGPGAPGDPRWERTKSRRMPVTSLIREVGRLDVLENGMLDKRIADAFGADANVTSEFTAEERSMEAELSARRYGLDSWHTAGLDRT